MYVDIFATRHCQVAAYAGTNEIIICCDFILYSSCSHAHGLSFFATYCNLGMSNYALLLYCIWY